MVEIDFAPVFEMQKKLVDIKAGTPEALKKALNETAKEARKRMVAQAQESYSVKKGRFNKAAKIKSATSGRTSRTRPQRKTKIPTKTKTKKSLSPLSLSVGAKEKRQVQRLKQECTAQAV